jgi:hypothetical protein
VTGPRSPVRYYSEAEHPLGPPRDQRYDVGPNGEPLLKPPDQRVWASVEWLAERGWFVPANWRELD